METDFFSKSGGKVPQDTNPLIAKAIDGEFQNGNSLSTILKKQVGDDFNIKIEDYEGLNVDFNVPSSLRPKFEEEVENASPGRKDFFFLSPSNEITVESDEDIDPSVLAQLRNLIKRW